MIQQTRMIGQILLASVKKWIDDKSSQSAAAVAFYTILSLAPLVMIALSLFAIFGASTEMSAKFIGKINSFLGPEVGRVIESFLNNPHSKETGILASILGTCILLFGATTVFAQFQSQLNVTWNVPTTPGKGIQTFIRTRLVSLGIIVIAGFLLLLSLVIDMVINAVNNFWTFQNDILILAFKVVNNGIFIMVAALLFSAMFKYLPDIKIQWKDVWIGGLITAILFTLGKYLIALYIGGSAVVSAYGAAGSLVVALIWVYYSVQIVFFGAVFSQVSAQYRK